MIDILFSESACGSLKASQKYSGNSFAFELALSIGDISNENFAANRQKTSLLLFDPHLTVVPVAAFDATARFQEKMNTICQRIIRGENIRIWYSNKPDELCGLYWFMAQLERLEEHLSAVSIIKLPEYEYRDDTIVCHVSWKEICHDEWEDYMALAELTTAVFRRSCAMHWHDLQQENAPLRICLNGQLISAPETLYDYLIEQEIERTGGEFCEINLIGDIIGRYQLGVSNGWFSQRIEKMIQEGKLSAVRAPEEGEPVFRRRLRSCSGGSVKQSAQVEKQTDN